MNATIRRCLARLWAGALAALLLGGFLAPSAARAGCSHYVVSRSDVHGSSVLTDLDILAASRQAEGVPLAPAEPSPCSGLSCSRDPMPPLAPSPPTFRSDFWGCLTDPPHPAETRPATRRIVHGPVHPVSLGNPPDRPPRPLA